MSGFTIYGADAFLAGTAMPTTLYVQFHTGDPGQNAIANIAQETDRQAVTLVDDAENEYQVVSDAAAQWLGIAADETIHYFTLWDAATVGNPWWVGEFSPAVDLVNGGSATITAGNIRISVAALLHGA